MSNQIEWIDGWATACLTRLTKQPRIKCENCSGTGSESAPDCPREICYRCKGKGSYLVTKGYAMLDRAIVDRLRDCQAFTSPPPPALIALIERRLLDGREEKAKDRDSARWEAAAKFRAANPNCTHDALMDAVKRAGQSLARGTVNKWLHDTDFIADVNFWAGVADDLRKDTPQTFEEWFVIPFR